MERSAYRKRTVDGRTESEHRAVWEAAHGPIPTGYLVHHKNGDKHDNRLANLELMTPAEHSRHHNDKHPRARCCDVCGVRYEPAPTKRARSRTCSPACFRLLAQTQRAGDGNGMAKLTEAVVLDARRRRATGERLKDLAAEFGVSGPGLSQAVNGKTWRHIGLTS